jgi:hypothetical protein
LHRIGIRHRRGRSGGGFCGESKFREPTHVCVFRFSVASRLKI